MLAIPQAALTLGNAIIATKEEHNALFPNRAVSVRLLAADHGLMNLFGVLVGGVPMCGGAGGMAGHVRFGATTGGALVILGTVLLAVALFMSDSVATLFRLFPMPVLGVILFFGGIELAASADGDGAARADRVVMVVTAGIALWSMGAGYLVGLLLTTPPAGDSCGCEGPPLERSVGDGRDYRPPATAMYSPRATRSTATMWRNVRSGRRPNVHVPSAVPITTPPVAVSTSGHTLGISLHCVAR